jgi:DNA-directed RNA polymerase specialized sigma subunit
MVTQLFANDAIQKGKKGRDSVNATEFLEQVKDADAKIECKRAEERELWVLATSMTQVNDGMPHAYGVSDKVGNIIQKIIKAQERTNAQIDRYIDIRDDVIRHIEMLPTKQYTVLHWLYVRKRECRKKNQSWYYTRREVAENLGCSEQNIYNTQKRAVRNLQKILDSEKKQEKVDCILV